MRAMDCYRCPAAHCQRIFSIHGRYQHERQCRRQTPQNGLPGGPAAAPASRSGAAPRSAPAPPPASQGTSDPGDLSAGWAFLATLPFAACARNPCMTLPDVPHRARSLFTRCALLSLARMQVNKRVDLSMLNGLTHVFITINHKPRTQRAQGHLALSTSNALPGCHVWSSRQWPLGSVVQPEWRDATARLSGP
eukprot:jgi/Mesvir1/25972/Mv25945-RA.1